MSAPRPVVNAMQVDVEAATERPSGFQTRYRQLGPLLAGELLGGTVSEFDPGEHLAGTLIGGSLLSVSDAIRIREIEGEKARRRAARELIGRYHDEQLRLLLDHVRAGFEKLDRGEIDPFELDELIHRYKRSAQKLWSFADRAAPRGSRRC
jgi:hypothetical protein